MRVGSLIENFEEYNLACIALNEYIEYGDLSLLEAYSNADIDFLLEVTDEEKRLGLSKKEIKRRRKIELIPQEAIKRGAYYFRYNDKRYDDLEDNRNPNLDPESLKRTEDNRGINLANRSAIEDINTKRFGDNAKDLYRNLHLSDKYNTSKDRLESLRGTGIPLRNYKQIHRVLNLDKAKNGFSSYALLNYKNLNDYRLGVINKGLAAQGYRPVSRENLKDPNFTLLKDTTPDTPKRGFDLSRLGGKKIEVHKSDTSTNYQNPNGNKTTTQSEPSEDSTKTGNNRTYRKLSGMTLKKKNNQASSIASVVNNNDTTSQNPEHSNPIPSDPPKTEEAKKEAVKQTESKMKNILDTSENKPRNVLARMVASLQNLYRKWLDKKNQAKQNGEDVGFFSNICRVILNCIDKLMWKIRNWSDGTKSNHYNSK